MCSCTKNLIATIEEISSFVGRTHPCLLLQMGQFLQNLGLELRPQVVCLLQIDLPLLPAQRVELEPRILPLVLPPGSLSEVLLDLLLDVLLEQQILHQQILINGHFLQYLLHLRAVEVVRLTALGSDVVDLIDLLLELRQLRLALQHQHDLQTVLLGGSQENERLEVADVLRVVGEVRVQLEVEVYVQVGRAEDRQPVGILALEEHQQPRTVLLPVRPLDVDEHLHTRDEEKKAVVLLQTPDQLALQQGVKLHIFKHKPTLSNLSRLITLYHKPPFYNLNYPSSKLRLHFWQQLSYQSVSIQRHQECDNGSLYGIPKTS